MSGIPIKYGKYLDENGQEQKVIFIGSEKAIYDSDGKRLDEKIAEMKALLEELKNVKQELENFKINDLTITKEIPLLSLNLNENTNATLLKNATTENDYGTSLIDKTNGTTTVLSLQNNKAYLDNVELVTNNKLNEVFSRGLISNVDDASINGVYGISPDTNMGTSGLSANFGTLVCFGYTDGGNDWRWQRVFYTGTTQGGWRTKVNAAPWSTWISAS